VDQRFFIRITGLAVAAFALGGCGGSEEQPQLTDYLSADAPHGSGARLAQAASIGMPTILATQRDPVAEAFDGAAITAAATGASGEGTLTAMRTTQPFGRLAATLVAAGYERDGDVVSGPDRQVSEVADAGDGVTVIADAGASAARAVADPPGGPPVETALLEPADQPIAQAASGFSDTCVRAYGGWESADGSAGTFRIQVDEAADPDRVRLDQIERIGSLSAQEPVSDTDTVDVPFTQPEDEGVSPIRDLLVAFPNEIYDCR
jgi:hypothetical protein